MGQLVIGKLGQQPFGINDEYVSRQHAILSWDDQTGVMTLTNQSRNGTFIQMGNQFQQIDQCMVDRNTNVRLGPFFTFRIGQLFATPVKPNSPVQQGAAGLMGGNAAVSGGSGNGGQKAQPKRADIAHLRHVAENYEQTKLQLDQKQSNINSLRTMSLVGSLAGGLVSGLLTANGDDSMKAYTWIGPAIAVILLIALTIYCASASKQIIKKKSENEKKYKIMFCCPVCHVPFAGRLYENILAESKCPKCKAEFFDSGI